MDNRQGFDERNSTKTQSSWVELYHAHHINHMEDLPFWQQLIKPQSGATLELGCGTGRITLPLALAGYCVFALDHDFDMLIYLKQRLHQYNTTKLFLFQADMTTFHLEQRFQTILLPCNTLSTLTIQQRQATFSCIYRHLEEAGIFAASIPNPRLLRSLPVTSPAELEEMFPHPTDGEPVQVSSAWKRTKDIFTFTWYYDHLIPDGRVERLSVQVAHRLDAAEKYIEELSSSGLETIALYGDFDESPYEEDSPNLILITKK
jgi:SAM-dependent methyltransferase